MLDPISDLHAVAMLHYDERFSIVDANRSAQHLLGRTRDELIALSGLDLVHPDDRASAASGLATHLGDPRRGWPAIVRILPTHGGPIHVTIHFAVLPSPIGEAKYVAQLVPATFLVAMDSLIDELIADVNVELLLERVLTAAEAHGLVRASVHCTESFSGAGVFSFVQDRGVGASIDLLSSSLAQKTRTLTTANQPVFVSLPKLALPETIAHMDMTFRGCALFPLRIRAGVVGALAVWTEQTEGLGVFAHAVMNRIATITGHAIERNLEINAENPIREIGPMRINLVERTVELSGKVVRLTPIESAIMGLLSDLPGRPVTRERIAQHLFGSTHIGDGRSSDVHIRNIRAKLGDDSFNPQLIVTVRGVGYAIRRPLPKK